MYHKLSPNALFFVSVSLHLTLVSYTSGIYIYMYDREILQSVCLQSLSSFDGAISHATASMKIVREQKLVSWFLDFDVLSAA